MVQGRYDCVVVGSGMGGGTVAQELAKNGKEVLVLEKGRREQKLGTFRDDLRYYDGNAVTQTPNKSKEGTILWRTFMAGGSTVVSCGNGVRSLEAELDSLGIPLGAELREMETELAVAPIDERLLSDGSLALASAASDLGYEMTPMPKFISAQTCRKCGSCVHGCPHGAKWTAVSQLDLLEQQNGDIWYGATVDRVIVENGRVAGVEGRREKRGFRVKGSTVILAAGGLSTPVILQNSGLEAGQGLFVDLLVNTYGTTSGLNQMGEPAMTMVGLQSHEDEGFLISPYVQHSKPVLMVEVGKQGLLMSDKKLFGMMTKITDDRAGRVYADGSISKPVTASDQVKLRRGSDRCREIMVKAGADPRSIVVSKAQGAHPGGTAAIGEVVDQNLETKISGLFACDASVLPTAPGLPPMLTIGALAKYLAKKLAG
jgi:choline dehydrogenase-like flavoprotein